MSESELPKRVVILGDVSVGKTALITRLYQGSFPQEYKSTITNDSYIHEIHHSDGVMKFCIFDTAGLEAFQSLSTVYIREAIGIIIVVDVTVKKTLEKVDTWLSIVDKVCIKKPVIIIAGNKSDLEAEREFSVAEALSTFEGLSLPYFECSAKTGQNVESVFSTLAHLIYTSPLPESFEISHSTDSHPTQNERCRC